MDLRPASSPPNEAINDVTGCPRNLRVGLVQIVGATRSVEGELGVARLEPLMLDVLTALAEQPGELISRQVLRDRCWQGAPVGDDSVNRAVAGVRKALTVATKSLCIRTVPGSGYTLRVLDDGASAELKPASGTATEIGWRSWRLGLPAPDLRALGALRAWVLRYPDDADAWGILALVARNAAEYAQPHDCMVYVEECQAAAARALRLRPTHARARSALITLPPLFGDWTARREQILDALTLAPQEVVLRHELAFLEMATGRPSAAVPLIESLIEEDPLAAIYQYKRVYHLWTLGRFSAMDQVADRSLQLWPKHPAIWFARFWSLTFSGRAEIAIALADDPTVRPPIPEGALHVARLTAVAMASRSDSARIAAIEANRRGAASGPAMCVAAIIHLAGLAAVDDAFTVARGYFLNDQRLPIPKHRTPSDPAVNDQNRRLTQMLFIPATEIMRQDARFEILCNDIGLLEFWRNSGLLPDYLKTNN